MQKPPPALGKADPLPGKIALAKIDQFLRGHPRLTSARLGGVLFGCFLLLALIGPAFAPFGINEQIHTAARQAPDARFWFGTDHLGRDVFSRIVWGAREVIFFSGTGTLLAALAGTFFGLLSGYIGGWLDEILMRIFDTLLSIPAMLLALLMLGIFTSSPIGLLIVLVFIYTPIVARVVRSVVLTVKPKAFIEAARTQGSSTFMIITRDIIPFILPTLAVETALRFSYAIFLISSLGFLGVGIQPPSPNWGLMVNEARSNFFDAPWALYYPAAAIALLVISVNLLADGLREVLLDK